MDIPKISSPTQEFFTGTGDLLAAMILAQTEEYENNFPKAIEKAVNIVRAVLLKSVEDPLMGEDEISLIASKSVIQNPPIDLKAKISDSSDPVWRTIE